jgi:hypothetical protein
MERKIISLQEVRFLAVGAVTIISDIPNPGHPWLSLKQWASIIDLAKRIPAFHKFDEDFEKNIEKWK